MFTKLSDFKVRLGTKIWPHFTVIGDLHGRYDSYLSAIERSEYSVCVGDIPADFDLGSTKDLYLGIRHLDSKRHWLIGGNHEPYNSVVDSSTSIDNPCNYAPRSKWYVIDGEVRKFTHLTENYLGHYGVQPIPGCENTEFKPEFFYVRGAWSIDHANRYLGVDMFKEEELTYAQATAALDAYAKVKPDFVISHACPQFVQSQLPLRFKEGKSFPSLTGSLLEQMYEIHQPKLWVFGHYHLKYKELIDDTIFVCLDRCEALHFDKHLQLFV